MHYGLVLTDDRGSVRWMSAAGQFNLSPAVLQQIHQLQPELDAEDAIDGIAVRLQTVKLMNAAAGSTKVDLAMLKAPGLRLWLATDCTLAKRWNVPPALALSDQNETEQLAADLALNIRAVSPQSSALWQQRSFRRSGNSQQLSQQLLCALVHPTERDRLRQDLDALRARNVPAAAHVCVKVCCEPATPTQYDPDAWSESSSTPPEDSYRQLHGSIWSLHDGFVCLLETRRDSSFTLSPGSLDSSRTSFLPNEHAADDTVSTESNDWIHEQLRTRRRGKRPQRPGLSFSTLNHFSREHQARFGVYTNYAFTPLDIRPAAATTLPAPAPPGSTAPEYPYASHDLQPTLPVPSSLPSQRKRSHDLTGMSSLTISGGDLPPFRASKTPRTSSDPEPAFTPTQRRHSMYAERNVDTSMFAPPLHTAMSPPPGYPITRPPQHFPYWPASHTAPSQQHTSERPYPTNQAQWHNPVPPTDVEECEQCHIKASPEWRRGPSGLKTLCNACGLKYYRFRKAQEKNR
ncbi:hypothetical protein RI367_003938 [Sorochytrium milnesiophthora]